MVALEKKVLAPRQGALETLSRQVSRCLAKSDDFASIPPSVWEQDWVVHCKPVRDGRTAFKYLAPYIFRVAISNRRIVKVENDQVTFRYKTNSGQAKFCTLPTEKFIHRFLQHVLPKSFVKVRYYGLFSPAHRQQRAALRAYLAAAPAQADAVDLKTPPDSSSSTSPSSRSVRCPACGHVMQLQAALPPLGRAPP